MHVACKHVRADDVHDVGSREGGETEPFSDSIGWTAYRQCRALTRDFANADFFDNRQADRQTCRIVNNTPM